MNFNDGTAHLPKPGTREYYVAELARYERAKAGNNPMGMKPDYIERMVALMNECIAALDSGKSEDEVWAMNVRTIN